MENNNWITVPSVFVELGFEPIPADTWVAGAMVREAYRKVVGNYPVKSLRHKTNGPGSHCFAVYPPEFRQMVENIVTNVASSRAKQFHLDI